MRVALLRGVCPTDQLRIEVMLASLYRLKTSQERASPNRANPGRVSLKETSLKKVNHKNPNRIDLLVVKMNPERVCLPEQKLL